MSSLSPVTHFQVILSNMDSSDVPETTSTDYEFFFSLLQPNGSSFAFVTEEVRLDAARHAVALFKVCSVCL